MKNRRPLLSVKTKLQGQLLWLVFAAMAVPTLVLGGGVMLLAPLLPLADLDATPEEFRASVLIGIAIIFPFLAAALFCWAFFLTNRLVGPIERMLRELDARIEGTATGPITLRPKDLLIPLVDKINVLIAEREELRRDRKP